MQKLSVIGLRTARETLIWQLMDLGVVELNSQEAKLADERWKSLVQSDSKEEEVSRLEENLARVGAALAVLEKLDPSPKPFIRTRRPMSGRQFSQAVGNRQELGRVTDELSSLLSRQQELKNQENRLHSQMEKLKPWMGCSVPLGWEGSRKVAAVFGMVPAVVQVEALAGQVEEFSDKTMFIHVSSDREQHYLVVVCLRDQRQQLLDELKRSGLSAVQFPEGKGTADEQMALCQKNLEELQQMQQLLNQEMAGYAPKRQELECLYDELAMERDRAGARKKILRTGSAFYLDGYMPEAAAPAVAKALEESGCWYEFQDIPEGEEAPVLLANGSLVKPFEAITDLYSLPDYRGIDATPFFALFYCIFFGMMLSDAAYGIVMAVGCYTVAKRFRLEGMMKKLVDMFFWCGISTTFWGILFGGWFGNIIQVVGETFFGMTFPENWTLAVWFDPVQQPMTLLIFSCILGVVHLFTGMAIKIYMEFRAGRGMDALLDIAPWYFIITGLPIWAVGGAAFSQIGMWMAILGAAVLVLTGGRKKKGIMKVFGGVMSLYDITSYLSDILSYSRLLALGLSTGVVATVINTIGSLLGGGLGGALLLLAIFIVGHTFNFAINALGSFVHSCRLQYVEFFGKFYEGGGRAFQPLHKMTKYVDIVKEDK